MARRLRLHFASRRSNTDPLSESLSSHGEDSGDTLSSLSPVESLAHSSVHLKVTPLSPDYANLPRYSSLFIPRVNCGRCNKKNILRISLQPCGKVSREPDGHTEDEDLGVGEGGAGSSFDGGSCNSSMASDAGYCSSNSIFEPEAGEKQRITKTRSLPRSKSKLPLRRCSSLVIFPKSPSSTPPASPINYVALPPLPASKECHQSSLHTSANEFSPSEEKITCKGSTNTTVIDHCLPKGSCSTDFTDSKHTVKLNIPLQDEPNCIMDMKGKVIETLSMVDRSNRHSSCVLLHFAQQRPKGATTAVNVEYPKALCRTEHPKGDQESYKKLHRSTSACVFSSTRQSEEKKVLCSNEERQEKAGELCCNRAIQRSISLEVPYHNTGISCHVSNAKLSSPCSPHVHIHLSPFYPSKLPSSVIDVNQTNNVPKSTSESTKVSVLFQGI